MYNNREVTSLFRELFYLDGLSNEAREFIRYLDNQASVYINNKHRVILYIVNFITYHEHHPKKEVCDKEISRIAEKMKLFIKKHFLDENETYYEKEEIALKQKFYNVLQGYVRNQVTRKKYRCSNEECLEILTIFLNMGSFSRLMSFDFSEIIKKIGVEKWYIAGESVCGDICKLLYTLASHMGLVESHYNTLAYANYTKSINQKEEINNQMRIIK
ncbi:MAG: hypothetical protein ACRCY4_09545 [Brevinema sp.]